MFKRFTLSVVAACSLVFASPVVGHAEATLPSGYSVLVHQSLARGLTRLLLTHANPPQRVNVALLSHGAAFDLRTVLSNDTIKEDGRRLESTSGMCRRTHCIVAVNGDFFSDEGIPLGAVVSGGELIRSPNAFHHQVMFSPGRKPSDGTFAWRGRLVSTDLASLSIDAVNVERGQDQIVLYTPDFGPSTETNKFGTEIILRVTKPAGPVRIGQTSLVEIASVRKDSGDSPIPPDGLVLSGHGRGAQVLLDLWARVRSGVAATHALLRIDSTPSVSESVGGTPILVRDGHRWFADENTSFVRARNPRTIVGWTRAGDVMLVTVDGRQPDAAGMSLGEAADLMIALGASDAINLDGGGSTAFVVRGSVVNQPSDRIVRRAGKQVTVRLSNPGEEILGYVERPVADALAIVPAGDAARAQDPFGGTGVELPQGLLRSRSAPSEPPIAVAGGQVKGNAAALSVMASALAAVVWRRRRVAAS